MKNKIISTLILLVMIEFCVSSIWRQDKEAGENKIQQIDKSILIIKTLGQNSLILNNIKPIKIQDDNSPKISLNNLMTSVGWLTSNVNIRELPDLNSKILDVWIYGEKISYHQINDEWCAVICNNEVAYIHKDFVTETEINYTEYKVPDNTIKTYMSYKKITYKNCNQYKLQKIAYTGNYGVRQVNNRYCIAIGSAYTREIGTYIDLILENGTVIPCILGDCKDDNDTDKNNIITKDDGSIVEFIIDDKVINNKVKKMGSLNFACDKWNSRISKIRIYDKKEHL